MAIGQTTTSNLAPLPAEVYERNMRERAIPRLLHALWGQRKSMSQRSGNSMVFTRFESLAKGTLLAEGVNPEPQRLQRTTVTAELATYGAYVEITDEVETQSPDPVLMEASDVLGESAGETIDDVIKTALHATTSIYYAGTAAGETVTSIDDADMTAAAVGDLEAIEDALMNNNAKYITEMINASTGVGTESVDAAFIGITDVYGGRKISALTGFTKAKDYASVGTLLPGEIGAIGRIRICVSSEAKVYTGEGSASSDVYSLLVLAKNAYGIVDLAGKALENIVHTKDSGIGGALNRYGTSGYTAVTCAKILNDNFMYLYLFKLA